MWSMIGASDYASHLGNESIRFAVVLPEALPDASVRKRLEWNATQQSDK